MKIEYLHASKYGNGAMVAEEFGRQMAAKGVTVEVHHIQDVNPKELPPAELYLFSSPARSGKPIRTMRRFLKKLALPSGTKYATLSTEVAPGPGRAGRVPRRAGRGPSEEDLAKWTRVRPVMSEILQRKGLVEVAEAMVRVTEVEGPLEEGWQHKVEAFVARIPVQN